MPLTPADVHNVAFKKPPIGKRGYDEEEVDAFLDEVERELARLIEENNELKAGRGGQIARAAGTYAQFVGRDGGYAQIRLSSGELRLVRQECMATVGAVSNPDNSNQNFGKAGRMRHKGLRPKVRGVVMNPIDHPHGGGEGRTSGGRHPVTPWGISTKGKKTRKNKRTNRWIVRRRNAAK